MIVCFAFSFSVISCFLPKYVFCSALLSGLEDLDDKVVITLLSPNKTGKGEIVFEGDIALDPSEVSFQKDGSVTMKSLPNKGGLWRTRTLPYEFHDSVSPDTVEVIKQAMDEWTSRTCLRFAPRESHHKNYLRFRTDSPGCYTLVGRKYSGGQDVNLGEGCQHLQIATHEIGHSLGFYHEHSRKDRTSHLRILWQNIKKGMTSQFLTGNDDPRGVPYDVTSIMHYSPMSFSNRMFEKNTMVSIDPHLQPLIGENRGITFRDAKLANVLYKCDENCTNKNKMPCKNGGYLAADDSTKKSECACVCPPNTKGEFCEALVGDYYGNRECGGDVVEETVIQTPGYPGSRKPLQSCTWKIQAPKGKRVCVEFLDFSFRPRFDKAGSKFKGLCVHEHVELRSSDGDDGDMYCAEDIKPGTRMCSQGNIFWIIVKADTKGYGRGLKAKISHTV